MLYTIIGGDGREYGPVSAEQVRGWLTAGRATLKTKAKLAGAEDWKSLEEFPDFHPDAPPPEIDVAISSDAESAAIARSLNARSGKLDVFSCYSRSWTLLKANLLPLVGVHVMILGLTYGIDRIPGLKYVSDFLLGGVFNAGLYFYILKKIRGQPTRWTDAFAGFQKAFLPLMLASVVMSLLVLVGFVVLILPGIYLAVGFGFAYILIIDKKLAFWAAMDVSLRVVTANWWRMFGLVLLAVPVVILGVLALGIGILVALPVIFGALTYAYLDLCEPKGGFGLTSS